jgi:hypothetical protein
MAERLIDTFTSFIGKRKGELIEVLESHEDFYDYRFVRGLATLLERRCTFESRSVTDPLTARRSVFEEANKNKTSVTDESGRRKVMNSVASSLNISVDDLERSLWADYEEELVLEKFLPIEPVDLLKSYNLSLAQTLLFKAMNMDFTVGSDYQRIFWRLKYLGLMYSTSTSTEHDDKRYQAYVDGPLSLFKLTKRYGTSLAKLLPEITTADDWEVNADIVRDTDNGPRILKFHLDFNDRDKFQSESKIENEREKKERFDSAVELKFFNEFKSLRTGWTLRREPEMMIAGTYVFIPDFLFEKDGMRCYMEIVGFWTEDYLKKKIGKLRSVEKENMIVAVDESLACSSVRDLKRGEKESENKKVIFYRKKVPLKPILHLLQSIEEKHIESELNRLIDTEINLKGNVLNVDEVAHSYGVGADAIKRLSFQDYKIIGDTIVSEDVLRSLRERIEAEECDNYARCS